MTTIVYRDGVMAGDRRVSSGSVVEHETTKVHRRSDGTLIGIAGTSTDGWAFVLWMLSGEPEGQRPSMDKDSQFEALVARPDGRVEWHNKAGLMPAEGPHFAIGSGRQFALGALDMGASVERALEIAVRRDCFTGPDFDVVQIDPDAWIATRAA